MICDTALFVTFEDIGVPESVKPVDVANMVEAFPNGAFKSLHLVDVEYALINIEPLTKKIDGILGWLTGFETMLDGSRISSINADNRFANSLGPHNFKQY